MFGLSWPILAGLVVGWLLAILLGWGCIHEYGVATAQASRDQAAISSAQAKADGSALAQQQKSDAKQASQLKAFYSRGESAVAWLHQFKLANVYAPAQTGRRAIRVVIRSEPPAACARNPIPTTILSQLNGH